MSLDSCVREFLTLIFTDKDIRRRMQIARSTQVRVRVRFHHMFLDFSNFAQGCYELVWANIWDCGNRL
jgi:hypothetical protein